MRVDGTVTSTNTAKDFNIHNVVVLDASQSMSGEKYNAATLGVKKELDASIEAGDSFTFIEFVQSGHIITHCTKAEASKVELHFNGATGGDTPLYQTIVQTLENLMIGKKSNDKFLVKILTDGQSNSGNKTALDCRAVIKKAEEQGFTVTFVAGEYDLDRIIREISIDSSNTLTHKNTGESIEQAYEISRAATISYRKDLSEGKDVTFGFYSKVLND